MVTIEESAVDRKLIEAYGKHMSVLEAAEFTGVAAEKVASRTLDALGRRDYLGENARMMLLMRQLEEMSDEVRSRLPGMSDRNISAAVNSAAGALGRVLGELRKMRDASTVDVTAISANQGRVLGEIVDIAVGHLRAELKERYPLTDDAELDDLLADGIRLGAKELESRVSG